jgi:hypothetical protein
MSYPTSLGSATHTRVDSAAKHIRQCKIHERLMSQLKGTTSDEMHRRKNQYATMKDDLVLNVNESIGPLCTPTDAYPSVMSNFTDLDVNVKNVIKAWFAKKRPREFHTYKHQIQNKASDLLDTKLNQDQKHKALLQMKILPFFRAQGYALGRAEGCMRTGDTVFSVLIGGQMTVNNGHFPMRPGQMVQWYFDFENDQFDDEGIRSAHADRKKSALGKRAHEETNAESTCIAMPKPYVVAHDGTEHYGDKIRIFAKCIMGGPAFQKVDIMLMTQSL